MKHSPSFEQLLNLIADSQAFGGMDDELSALIDEETGRASDELGEDELEWVFAAAKPSEGPAPKDK